MSTFKKITISLPQEMLAEIRAAVEAGEFTNASEAVVHAVRQWSHRRGKFARDNQSLRRLVVEGRDSGAPVDGKAVLDRLRSKYAAMSTG